MENPSLETSENNEENFLPDFDQATQEGLDGSLNLAEESVRSLSEITSGQNSRQIFSTTIRVKDKDYPVLIKETPALVAKHILNHNRLHGFTQVVFIGKSGTGKSTLTATLTHYLHTIAGRDFKYNYVPMWFKQRDIENIDNIIQGLEKGINRILIFEDASFTFNYSDTADIEEVMRRLTYVRHTLQAKVIVMIQIHYAKALEKFLRDGDVKLITSISDEEKDNLYRLFGWDSKKAINYFAHKYHMMETSGYWYTDVSMTKVFYYKTQEPFRLGLVSDFGKLHTMVYHETDCEFCRRKYDTNQTNNIYQSMALDEFLNQMGSSYTLNRVRTQMKNLFYFREGLDVIEPKSKYVIHRLQEYFHTHPKDYEGLKQEVASGKSVDMALRQHGLMNNRKQTNEEKRKERTANKKSNTRKKVQQLLAAVDAMRVNGELHKPASQEELDRATQEGLAAAGLDFNNPGPMSDDEIDLAGDDNQESEEQRNDDQ